MPSVSNARVFVQGEEIDFDGIISQNYQVFDVKTLSDRKSEFSQSITVPDTPKNKKIFVNAHLFQATNKSELKAWPCNVQIKGSDALGDAVLVFQDYTPGVGWASNIYAGNYFLFSKVGGNIADVNLSGLNFLYTAAEAASRSTGAADVSWSPINFGVDFQGVDIEYNYFAVRADRIFSQIIADIGLTYTFVNGLISTNDYVVVEAIRRTGIQAPQNGLSIGDKNMNAATNGIWIEGLTPGISGIITPQPPAGFFTLKMRLGIAYNGAGVGIGTIKVLKNAVEIFSQGLTIPTGQISEFEVAIPEFEQIAGQDITLQFISGGPTNSWVLKAGSTGTLTQTTKANYNSTIDVALCLPEMTKKDFLKDYVTRNGIVFDFKASTGVLQIMKFNDMASQPVLDWSDLLDVSTVTTQFQEVTDDYAQLNTLNYKEDDPNAGGSGSFTISNGGLEASKVVYSSPFAASRDSSLAGRQAALIRNTSTTGTLQDGTATRAGGGGNANKFDFSEPHNLIIGQYIIVTISGAPAIFQVYAINTPTRVTVDRNASAAFTSGWYIIEIDVSETKPRLIKVGPTFTGSVIYRYRGTVATAASYAPTYFGVLPSGGTGGTLNWSSLLSNSSLLISILQGSKMIKANFNLQPKDIKFFNRVYINYFDSFFYINKVSKLTPGKTTECELIKIT